MNTLLRQILGIQPNTTSHAEKLISISGALLGLLAVYEISEWYLADQSSLLMIASMGATAILLFGSPHGVFSQPWPVLGGHLLAAAIGVTCHKLFPITWWTPALAAATAMAAMQYLRCLHPPAGATSMIAVIGGDQVYTLGYGYLITPVLMNVMTLLLVAFLFNALFAWRRYPAGLMRRHEVSRSGNNQQDHFELTREDFAAALEQTDSYLDITAEQMAELLELAHQHSANHPVHPDQIRAGRCYSNGKLGKSWGIRQVITLRSGRSANVIYRTLAGTNKGETGSSSLEGFRLWARYEVVEQQDGWVKAGSEASD
ncbi:HPP family protein [Nitrincola sp. MINF-07-Sa-05]|uniref:HPP family protein n=1 Tax=Nitrincola salilacus TaxID=3400273 RepID=UPI003918467A